MKRIKEEKGFTLIELLAVIIILSIIALITVPVVMNIIENANKSAFKDSAYGIIKAGELYYADKLLDSTGMTNDIIFTFPEAEGLQVKGSRPKNGNMIINIDGDIKLAISNGKYCVRKEYNDSDIKIDENIDDCKIPNFETETPKQELENLNPNIKATDSCIKYNEVCSNGLPVIVKVNNDQEYLFHIINDTGTELTLVMANNIGEPVPWNTYNLIGMGPTYVLDKLEELTNDWINVPTMTYTQNVFANNSITRQNVRARILSYEEVKNLGCDYETHERCPFYLYPSGTGIAYQESNYWLASGYNSTNYAYYIDGGGFVKFEYISNELNIRAVIKISKTV